MAPLPDAAVRDTGAMNPERWQRCSELFDACVDLTPAQRVDLLARACADDAALRAEVEGLLQASEGNTRFLQRAPGAGLAATLLQLASASEWIGKRVGSYRITEQIACGGMGEVYKAVRADDQYRMQVAIKLVRRDFDSQLTLDRFQAERQILAALDHPNIARLLDAGVTEDGRPFFVMEFIEGVPIDQHVDAHKLPVNERLLLFRTVCGAVQYAHQHLVVHRDLKPSNILVASDGTVKLLDFGIAKVLDQNAVPADVALTRTGAAAFTPAYCSPEQLRGEPITTASDVYSLGVVLYRLLTGQGPYRALSSDPYAITREVCESQPQRPSVAAAAVDGADARALRRRLQGDLDSIVMMALRKAAQHRYPSVERLSDDIGRHLANQPVTARRGTFRYRSVKYLQRNKLPFAVALALVLSLGAGLVSTERQARVARAEKAIAEQQRERAQRHFDAVRKLAHALMFDMHDAIAYLPGSTPARQLLVTEALRYLDGLANEATDPALNQELAAAYERVGDVQGGYRSSNLGDLSGALHSYGKALAIRQALARAAPDDVALGRHLLRSHGKVGTVQMQAGDTAGALEQGQAVLAIASRLAARPGADTTDRRNLAMAHANLGWTQAHGGQAQAGLGSCRQAVDMLEPLVAGQPGDRGLNRLLAVSYR